MEPQPFQRFDLDFLRNHNYTGLLNMETGAGKTVTGSFSILESGARTTLIIAPDSTHKTAWGPTVEVVCGVEARVIGNKTKATRTALFDLEMGYPGVYLVTPEFFTRTRTDEWTGDLLITDESHRLAGHGTAGNIKWVGNAKRDRPIRERFDGRLSLSGTSLRNSFERAWSQGRYLWPELNRRYEVAHDNFWVWRNDRMEWEMTYTHRKDKDGRPIRVKSYTREKIAGLWLSQCPSVILHLKRENCCEFHPRGFLPLDAPKETHITVPLHPAQKKAIKELEYTYTTWLGEGKLTVEFAMTLLQRLRQITLGCPEVHDGRVTFPPNAKSPYMDWLLEFLEGTNEPVVVYTSSQQFISSVAVPRLNKAGFPAFEYSGATTASRDDDLAKFGTKYQVAVCSLGAIAEGTDGLQKVSKTEVWLDRSLDETINTQTEGRLDRMGGIGQVDRYFLHDDLGLSNERYFDSMGKRLELTQSLRY